MIKFINVGVINVTSKALLAFGVLLVSVISPATVLTSVEIASLPGNATEIKFGFDSAAPEVMGYSIEQPARIALDLLATTSDLENEKLSLSSDGSRKLMVLEDASTNRTRVIISLDQMVGYETRAEGNDLFVVLGGQYGAQGVSSVATAGDVDKSITDVDFRRDANGSGQIVISLSDDSIPVDIRESGGKIYAELLGVTIPEKLQRRLDVTDFGTPVKFIDLVPEGDKGLLVIEPEGEWEYLAYQTDNVLTINVQPLTAVEIDQRKTDTFLFSGEKLSLNFQDIEVRSVLQLIADFTSLNLVASDTVTGSITLRLQNVPWDQALDLILKTKGLDKRQVGNVLLVAPAAEIAAREKLELESSEQIEALAPLRSDYIVINYAKAADLLNLISGDAGILTERGSASVDVRTNTLIINDNMAKLAEIRSLIQTLDIPVRQVLIEARIVLANTNFNHEFGVKWGGFDYDIGSRSAEIVTGKIQNVNQFAEAFVNKEIFEYNERDNLLVDLGTPNANAPSFAVGISSLTSGLLELELSAIEQDGHGEVVSTPKVLTADQQTARIGQGTQIPYKTASSSGATTIQYIEAELSLEVTPHITPDNKIIMDLVVTNNTVGEVFEGQPSINSNSVETNVLVANGETVVLGGIFQATVNTSSSKVPFLGDLPVIGRFFRNEVSSEDKAELLIFITPKIVGESYFSG